MYPTFSPLVNARDTTLDQNPGSLPNLSEALGDWMQPMQFVQITKTTVNFQLVEIQNIINTKGVRQSLNPQELKMVPEGQRAWLHEHFYCLPGFVVKPDDIILFQGVKYRVLEYFNWSDYGYVFFHCYQDYSP